MTALLSKAFEKASDLPEKLQDELAREVMEEIEWEKKWNSSLAKTSDKIDELAQKALDEYRAGKTTEAGFDEL